MTTRARRLRRARHLRALRRRALMRTQRDARRAGVPVDCISVDVGNDGRSWMGWDDVNARALRQFVGLRCVDLKFNEWPREGNTDGPASDDYPF